MLIGNQDRWFNSDPSPVMYDNAVYSLGVLDRWFNSDPAPIMGKFVAGDSDTYHKVTTAWDGADTLDLYIDGTLFERNAW